MPWEPISKRHGWSHDAPVFRVSTYNNRQGRLNVVAESVLENPDALTFFRNGERFAMRAARPDDDPDMVRRLNVNRIVPLGSVPIPDGYYLLRREGEIYSLELTPPEDIPERLDVNKPISVHPWKQGEK